MSVLGIDDITYSSNDLSLMRRFFTDWGLTLKEENADTLVFECLNGCRVVVAHQDKADLPTAIEEGPTLRGLRI